MLFAIWKLAKLGFKQVMFEESALNMIQPLQSSLTPLVAIDNIILKSEILLNSLNGVLLVYELIVPFV